MRHAAAALGAFALLAGVGSFAPKWLTFLLTMAAGNGLVSLGIVCLMRGGVVPFGQGMVFAIGGYAAALIYNRLGFTDAIGLALAGGVAAVLIAAPFAPLLSRYRGIFFAMLTLALSMVTYGLLMKLDDLRRLRRLQRRPADAARQEAARRQGRLHPLPRHRRLRGRDGGAGARSTSTARAAW